MFRSDTRRRAGGFALLELIVAIVVLGLVFAGFVSVYGSVLRQGAEPQLQIQAVSIASAYLDEALSRSYADPDGGSICGAPEAQRPLYDDVCDYRQLALNGCASVSVLCPALGDCACDRLGAPVEGTRGFTVSAGVSPATLSGADGLQVLVQVDHGGLAGGVRLQAFRAAD